ncbi:hypothetical protein ACIQM4_00665 [Streptomyces sp. NPDC091272]|uniref:hypothetical protein n=1 Tax=Streptomyces sp. NPDC091272 TaxID=3365981 RepID=UPI00380C8E05
MTEPVSRSITRHLGCLLWAFVDEPVTMLKQPPRDERRRTTAIDSREIKAALDRIGIRSAPKCRSHRLWTGASP